MTIVGGMTISLRYCHITVNDLDESLAFYRDALGTVNQPQGLVIPGQTAHPATPAITHPPCGIA